MQGDALAQLRMIGDDAVDCVVTSPPYYGLRDYEAGPEQIGLEDTPAQWVENLVKVFREVRRVLTPHGTCWVNLGDKYVTDGGNGHQGNANSCRAHRRHTQRNLKSAPPPGMKPKNLMMLPARVAIAMQDDGWYLRQRCIWHKPSPMPESTKGRPTTDYEDIFMFTKGEGYFYDAFAVMEATTGGAHARGDNAAVAAKVSTKFNRDRRHLGPVGALTSKRNLRAVWRLTGSPFADEKCLRCGAYYDAAEKKRLKRTDDKEPKLICECGSADSWLAHFATFPPSLPDLCIRASTSEQGVCAWCRRPIVRIVKRVKVGDWTPHRELKHRDGSPRTMPVNLSSVKKISKNEASERLGRGPGWRNLQKTVNGDKRQQLMASMAASRAAKLPHEEPFPAPEHVGWEPCCPLNLTGERLPAVVLDPFAGMGTTLMVAERLGRTGLGIELRQSYIDMAVERMRRDRLKRQEAVA